MTTSPTSPLHSAPHRRRTISTPVVPRWAASPPPTAADPLPPQGAAGKAARLRRAVSAPPISAGRGRVWRVWGGERRNLAGGSSCRGRGTCLWDGSGLERSRSTATARRSNTNRSSTLRQRRSRYPRKLCEVVGPERAARAVAAAAAAAAVRAAEGPAREKAAAEVETARVRSVAAAQVVAKGAVARVACNHAEGRHQRDRPFAQRWRCTRSAGSRRC